jgi:hypothetical protein
MMAMLRDGVELSRFHHLLEVFFPDEEHPRSNWSLLDVASWFFNLVDDDLFPLNLGIMDSFYGATGDVHDVIMWGIPYTSYGVPHEIMALRDLATWAQPVVALAQGVPDRHEFWEDAGVVPTGRSLEWARDPEVAILYLQDLEPPLDGLAVAVRCVLKNTGNPFFDVPDLWHRWEYLLDMDEYWWEEGHIRELTRLYQRAEPEIWKLQRYIEWVDQDWEHAFNVIAHAFIELEGTYV